jgi:hypothetical protein
VQRLAIRRVHECFPCSQGVVRLPIGECMQLRVVMDLTLLESCEGPVDAAIFLGGRVA